MAELSIQDIQALVNKMQAVNHVETYVHFPEVISAGPYRLDQSELQYLLNERLIEQTHTDAIGKLYGFTPKFKTLTL